MNSSRRFRVHQYWQNNLWMIPVINAFAGAMLAFAMVALDKPDTRSWTTLPDRVWIGRVQVPPGQHTLQLVLGDELHIPHDPPIVSERITIEVR